MSPHKKPSEFDKLVRQEKAKDVQIRMLKASLKAAREVGRTTQKKLDVANAEIAALKATIKSITPPLSGWSAGV